MPQCLLFFLLSKIVGGVISCFYFIRGAVISTLVSQHLNLAGLLLCGVYMFSLSMCGFFPGTAVSSQLFRCIGDSKLPLCLHVVVYDPSTDW